METRDFKELLHKRSLKATGSRMKLLNFMDAYKSAIPYSAIQNLMAPIDRVTLYRTLESLKAKGIIHIAYQEDGETYYAICGDSCVSDCHHHEHAHFKCVECHTVTCEPITIPVDMSIPDYKINNVVISIEGICKSCNASA